MSTQIAIIQGREENLSIPIEYYPVDLYISRFSGGKEGMMLQLTTGNFPNVAHIQLNKEQIEQLKTILNNWEEAPKIE